MQGQDGYSYDGNTVYSDNFDLNNWTMKISYLHITDGNTNCLRPDTCFWSSHVELGSENTVVSYVFLQT